MCFWVFWFLLFVWFRSVWHFNRISAYDMYVYIYIYTIHIHSCFLAACGMLCFLCSRKAGSTPQHVLKRIIETTSQVQWI